MLALESVEKRVLFSRHLCRTDLFFLLTCVLKRGDAFHPWIYDRCREVQKSPNGHLDVWSRTHYKSSIITFAKTIQDILIDPNITIGIFSHTRPIAKSFLRQIMREFESNNPLKMMFQDILWENPRKDSPKWSEDDGIVVQRKANPKESTVEAWGLVDGQPTSRHFSLRVYDDVVVPASVSTPEQIRKTTEAWEHSESLGTDGGNVRYIGTRYAINDTYAVLLERGVAKLRMYPATDNGRMDGKPVLLTKEQWEIKKRNQSVSTLSSQYLQNPIVDENVIFHAASFKLWPSDLSFPEFKYIVQSYDTGFTEKTDSDSSACTTWGVFYPDDEFETSREEGNNKFCVMLIDAWDAKISFPKLRKKAIDEYQMLYGQNDKAVDVVLIEDKGSGISLRQELVKAGVPVIPYNPGKADKRQRAHAVSHYVSAGMVYLPESPQYIGKPRSWAGEFMKQVTSFPFGGGHDDYVDTFTQALKLLSDQTWLKLDDAAPEIMEDDVYDEPAMGENPYG